MANIESYCAIIYLPGCLHLSLIAVVVVFVYLSLGVSNLSCAINWGIERYHDNCDKENHPTNDRHSHHHHHHEAAMIAGRIWKSPCIEGR